MKKEEKDKLTKEEISDISKVFEMAWRGSRSEDEALAIIALRRRVIKVLNEQD